MAEVRDEKAELSTIFKDKARAIVESIDGEVISKGNLLQRATSAAICLDKSLILAGEMPTVNLSIMLDLVQAIRTRRDEESERQFQQAKARLEGRTIEALPDET